MDLVSIYLALVACLNMAVTVNLHSHPIIAIPQDLLHHGVSIGMRPKGAFMDFHYDLVCFLRVHTY